MDSLNQFVSVFALLLPVAMLLTTAVFLFMLRWRSVSPHEYERFLASGDMPVYDPSRDIDISAYVAKKASREMVRVVLERYRNGTSELNNAPLETEYLTERILFAYSLIHSTHEAEIISGLQTFDALGTRDLLLSLNDDFEQLAERWRTNVRISSLIGLTQRNMANQLDNGRTVLFSNQPEANKMSEGGPKSPVEVSY